ncbi:hypothetical protein TWF569_005510 [Orbilia oligospora]|nr:hypothetical protein TWF569_005510 [Orbilia oligospora]
MSLRSWSYKTSGRDYSPVREDEAPGPRREPLYSDYAEDWTEKKPEERLWEERKREWEERRRREREEMAQKRELRQRRVREDMALRRELHQRREQEERARRPRAMESQQWERERGGERIRDLELDDVDNDHRYGQTRRPLSIKKEVWYPNLRQSLLDSGLDFEETETSFVVYNATDEQVAQIKGDALEKVPAAPPFDGGEDGNESGSTSSDDEYDILHYSFKPDGESEDETPPRVLNPGPHAWWFDVPLKSSGDGSSPLKNIFHETAISNDPGNSTYRRAFTVNRQQPESQKSIKCVTKRIISSRRSIRAEVKDDTIKLIAATANPSGRETSLDDLRFRWVHFQNPVLNLEEFKEQVVRIPGLEDHDLIILCDLFEKVKDKMERTYIHGKYLEEGAIRCDGKSGKECCAVTFIVIPTLKLQPLELPSILRGQPKAFQSADHAPRPLMQTTVNMSSTLEEDKRQASFSSKLVPKDQAIHVVQTWVLVINDKLLVTYSPSTLEDIAGPSIEIEDGKQDDGVTIRVGTTFDGAHYFPAEKCKTWFEFQAELKKVMRPSRYEHYKEKDAVITCKDGTILNSQNWAAKLGETRLKLFRLTLELKPRKMISDSSSRSLGLLPAPPPPPPSGDAYSLVPYSGRPSRRPRMPPPRNIHRQPSDLDFKKNLERKTEALSTGSRRPGNMRSRFYESATVPSRSDGFEYEAKLGYGAEPGNTYRRPPTSDSYDPPDSTEPRNTSYGWSSNYGMWREDFVSNRGRPQPAVLNHQKQSSSPKPPPRAPSLESRGRLGTTITDVDDEDDAPSRHDIVDSSEDSESPRWRPRRRFPLALPAPPGPSEREPGTNASTRDESVGPAGSSLVSSRESSTQPPARVPKREPIYLNEYSETLSVSSESDSEEEEEEEELSQDVPRPRSPALPQATHQSTTLSSGYRGRESSGGTSEPRDFRPTDESAERDIHEQKFKGYEAGEIELREKKLARSGRRVTFASSLPSQPSFRSDYDTSGGLLDVVSSDIWKPENRSGRQYSPVRQSSTSYSREAPTTSKHETAETTKPQDHDSIFFYLPSERPTEKAKEKEIPDQKQTTPELPKVLPVFQWLTKASAENKLIERQFLSRKRSASRGSRNSNTLKKTPPAEVEASDESYSILKNILNELQRRLETTPEPVRSVYLSCDSSDSIEVEKSIMDIENTTLLLTDSPEKSKTLDLIAERKKILGVCRKIISFFIPLNWKEGQVVERLWYSILQLVTVGINDNLVSDSDGTPGFPSDILLKLEGINRHIQVIVTGVAGDNIENPSFRIPSALFEAFLQFTEAMLFAAVVVILPKDNGLPSSSKKDYEIATVRRKVDRRLSTCKSRLREGKFQLMCMILTGRTKDQMKYEEACTETVVSFILRSLICLPITKVEGASTPMGIYRERLMNIDTEAKYRPQQRILQDILYLGAEVGAFDKVRMIQSRVLWAADTLLHPKGSLDMKEPRSRDSLIYSPPRGKMGGGVEYFFSQEEDHVKDYLKRANNLYGSVEEALSLKEEDNGKAIMVFTIVTTVFLPLNFVTSFFGMNTTDIRDIDRDQKIFWTTAIPVTIAVLGFALCWAYFGDAIQDRIFGPYSRLGKLFKGKLNSRRKQQVAKVIVEGDEDEDEKYDPAPKYVRDEYEANTHDHRQQAPAPYSSHSHHHHDRVDPPNYYDHDRTGGRDGGRDRGYSQPQDFGQNYGVPRPRAYASEYSAASGPPYGSRTRSSGYEGSINNEETTRYRGRPQTSSSGY